jgi:hypothetical protein
MRKCGFILLLLWAAPCVKLAGQEAEVGVTVPLTITGDFLDTNRAKDDNPSASPLSAGFRVLVSPQAKLGPNWYFYSAIQVYSAPFFYDDTYRADRYIAAEMLQMFLGYTRSFGKASVSFKVGKLTSAFGEFPLRYDDASNPMLDQPLLYTYMKLRPDQLPCGVADLKPGPWPDVGFHCGGAKTDSYGITPVTLWGLPGAEADLSSGRVDARFQLTNSSPANPQGFLGPNQHPQWTGGGGYTIRHGFRVGMSAFRGPWLDSAVKGYLPPASSVGDFPASGVGADGEWARGPWSANGEWGRFIFRYPNFRTSPTSSFGYIELKRVITPRFYSAFRANYQANNHPEDLVARSADTFLPNCQAYEVALGFRPDRFVLLKVGYEWLRMEGVPGTRDNVFGVQVVTSINSLSKALK